MDPRSLTSALRVLRVCLHLLLAALLALVAVRAVLLPVPHAALTVLVAVLLAVVYAVGPRVVRLRGAPRATAAWVGVLGLGWVGLVVLSADGVWLAFPLFFLQLHLLPRRWGLVAVGVTAVAAMAGFGWHQHGLSVGAVLGPALGAAVAVATTGGYRVLYRENEQRRALIEELLAARQELADQQHAAGVAAERERLAREIHDTLAQGLSSIQLLLRATERALPGQPEVAAGHVAMARRTAQENLAEARRFVRALTPPDLTHRTLPAALERLSRITAERSGLAVHVQVSGTPVDLPTPYEVALLRIAQSALANTVRHAHARRVELTLSYMEDAITLDAVDDGIGFDPATVAERRSADGGFGLAAMRTRLHELGGALTVESAPGEGTALAATLPLLPGSAP